MVKLLTDSGLVLETRKYNGTGGTSHGNGEFGFIPAFKDTTQGDIFLSRCGDGSLAKVHLLDGMPDHLVATRENGRVTAVHKSVVAGFVLNKVFFTRDEAAFMISENLSCSA